MKVIDLQKVEFRYSSAKKLTLNINHFSLDQGEKVFIYGPSGCGKTTFLEVLSGVLVPQKGSLTILNKNIVQLSPKQRDEFRAAHIGYIFQSFNLIPYLNIFENITLPLYLSAHRRLQVPHSKEKEEAKKICASLGILEFLDKPVNELSVGQQQRVAVARALLGKPELILADEPTSSLDQDHREKFIELLFSVANEHRTSILFVSHDRSLQSLFDRSVSLPDINHGSTQ